MIIISLILMICAHLGSETAQGSLQRCVCLCSHLVWGTLAHCCIELESYMFRKISESSSFVLRWQGFFPQKLKLFLELNVILVNCIFNVHNNLWKQFLPQFSTTHLLSVVYKRNKCVQTFTVFYLFFFEEVFLNICIFIILFCPVKKEIDCWVKICKIFACHILQLCKLSVTL